MNFDLMVLGDLWCAHNSCYFFDDRGNIGHDCCMNSSYKCSGQDGCCLDRLDSINLLVFLFNQIRQSDLHI